MSSSKVPAHIAKIAILVFAGAMALRQMGLANEIINLAFGLLLGAIAVAVALAFGLGGKEIAAQEIKKWLEGMNRDIKKMVVIHLDILFLLLNFIAASY